MKWSNRAINFRYGSQRKQSKTQIKSISFELFIPQPRTRTDREKEERRHTHTHTMYNLIFIWSFWWWFFFSRNTHSSGWAVCLPHTQITLSYQTKSFIAFQQLNSAGFTFFFTSTSTSETMIFLFYFFQ